MLEQYSYFVGIAALAYASLNQLLIFIGFRHISIPHEPALGEVCDAIRAAVAKCDLLGHNLIVVPSTSNIKVDKVEPQEKDDPQCDLDNDKSWKLYCDCHGLKPLSLNPFGICLHSRPLFFEFDRGREYGPEQERRPMSWKILGAYEARRAFLKNVAPGYNTTAVVPTFKMHHKRRREVNQYWRGPINTPARRASTVIVADEIKHSIDRVRQFIEAKSKYLERCQPHRFGMLFYGPPGTGKSSWASALAYELGYSIYKICLGEKELMESELEAMFDSLPPKSIVLLEDIDRVKLRKGLKQCLFNVLDGVGIPNTGRIIIMTANDITKIDSTLIREGRIHEKFQFQLPSNTQIKQLFLHSNVWTLNETEKIALDTMATCFLRIVCQRQNLSIQNHDLSPGNEISRRGYQQYLEASPKIAEESMEKLFETSR
jgi:chaperone BCS1